jgi:hypothetical protein
VIAAISCTLPPTSANSAAAKGQSQQAGAGAFAGPGFDRRRTGGRAAARWRRLAPNRRRGAGGYAAGDSAAVAGAVVSVAAFMTLDRRWPTSGFVVAWLRLMGLGFLNRLLFSDRCPFYVWVVVTTSLVAGVSLVPG